MRTPSTWQSALQQWESDNLTQTGRYIGMTCLDRFGFRYRGFEYVPITERYSAMMQHSRAMRAFKAAI